jgi:hypothetical protein
MAAAIAAAPAPAVKILLRMSISIDRPASRAFFAYTSTTGAAS